MPRNDSSLFSKRRTTGEDSRKGMGANDRTRWSRLIEDNLPPIELWPTYVRRLPELSYPEGLNLGEALLVHARIAPGKCAIRFRGESVSYEALRRRVMQLTATLAAIGVEPTDRVGLRLPNCADFIAAWLAIQRLGAICVQLPEQYRRRELAHVLNHSGASTVICDAGFLSDFGGLRTTMGSGIVAAVLGSRDRDSRGFADAIFLADVATDDSHDPDAYPSPLDQPAVITYITDSAGALKGAVHSPAEILASADTYGGQVLELTSSDVCIGTTSLAWAFGLGALLTCPLRAGATIVLPDGPMQLLQAIADERATVLFSVPTMYRMLLRHPDLDRAQLGSLRCCISATEPLSAELVEQWHRRTGLDIVDGFGTTELTHIVISARPGNARPGFIGTVVPGYEARIVDANMQDVQDGRSGLLAVRGPTGARYWRDDEAQRRVVRDGWTLTGDVCVRTPDGWFQHIGRADALVVSAGYKIAVREVERVLEEHPDVASARVFPTPDPIRGAVTNAVVVRAENVDAVGLAERLQQYLKAELAPFKCPRHIHIE